MMVEEGLSALSKEEMTMRPPDQQMEQGPLEEEDIRPELRSTGNRK